MYIINLKGKPQIEIRIDTNVKEQAFSMLWDELNISKQEIENIELQ
jgi:antitoxin component of RelBE/YafQ-DinJ toxin-antitoxin module